MILRTECWLKRSHLEGSKKIFRSSTKIHDTKRWSIYYKFDVVLYHVQKGITGRYFLRNHSKRIFFWFHWQQHTEHNTFGVLSPIQNFVKFLTNKFSVEINLKNDCKGNCDLVKVVFFFLKKKIRIYYQSDSSKYV